MGAQRKLAEPALTIPPVEAPQVDYQSPMVAGSDHPVSPAILLQEELAARIADSDRAPAAHTDEAPEFKLPMALRIATIVTLSVALWGGVFLAAEALIT